MATRKEAIAGIQAAISRQEGTIWWLWAFWDALMNRLTVRAQIKTQVDEKASEEVRQAARQAMLEARRIYEENRTKTLDLMRQEFINIILVHELTRRKWHNTQYLQDGLVAIREYYQRNDEPFFIRRDIDVAYLAWFYHKLYGNNLSVAAKRASGTAGGLVGAHFADQVYKAVCSTAPPTEVEIRKEAFYEDLYNHGKIDVDTPKGRPPILSQVGAILSDTSQLAFSLPPERYDYYVKALEQETDEPINSFRTKRKKLLSMLLSQPTIYTTAFFQQRAEEAAQQNAARELATYI